MVYLFASERVQLARRETRICLYINLLDYYRVFLHCDVMADKIVIFATTYFSKIKKEHEAPFLKPNFLSTNK
jgi:hypothetical protein